MVLYIVIYDQCLYTAKMCSTILVPPGRALSRLTKKGLLNGPAAGGDSATNKLVEERERERKKERKKVAAKVNGA